MIQSDADRRLNELYNTVQTIPITDDDKIAIFSDLHMGDGGRRDEFVHHSEMMMHVLKNRYLQKNYQLILNGDIEELYKFELHKVIHRWRKLYHLLRRFDERKALYKIVGNHDMEIDFHKKAFFKHVTYPGLKLSYQGQTIFVVHGHQASYFLNHLHTGIRMAIRYIVTPLGIMNYTVAQDRKKKLRTENRIYTYAKSRKIIMIIGHTHRPLFESLSKEDSLRFKVEQLIRSYPFLKEEDKAAVEKRIIEYNQYINKSSLTDDFDSARSTLYSKGSLIPCVFNSGCAIGKRGVTGLEIKNGMIKLLYFYNSETYPKEWIKEDWRPKPIANSPYHRVVLNSDSLNYIFTRIRLLA